MTTGTQEQSLLDQARRLSKSNREFQAAYFRLDRLRNGLPSDAHLTLSQQTIENFARKYDAACYQVLGSNRVLICENQNAVPFEKLLARLNATFNRLQPDTDADALINIFDLEHAADEFCQVCEIIVQDDRQRRARLAKHPSEPIAPDSLDALQRALASSDVSNLLRHQKVCAMPPGHAPKPVFTEYFVSMAALRKSLAPTLDLFSNQRLFHELLQTLDKRLFVALLEKRESIFSGPLSFNLTLETLTYPEFLRFAEEAVTATNKSLVMELEVSDVLAHLPDFMAMRPFFHDLGLKVLIQGVDMHHLETIELRRLEADLLKLPWQNFADKRDSAETLLKDKLGSQLGTRCILSHCDTEDAVAFGRRLGVQAFQGYHIDKKLRSDGAGDKAASA